MNDRQRHALTHPLSLYPGERAETYRTIRQRGDGTLLVIILAVDR